jgi:hypothetical protein
MAFEVFLEQDAKQSRPQRWWWLICLASISLHLGALLVVDIQSVWRVDEISPRGIGVTFLSVGTPPVPPPPPAARKANRTQDRPAPSPVARVKPDQLVQPREQASQQDPGTGEAGSDDGEVEGVAGSAEARAMGATAGAHGRTGPRAVDLMPVMLGPSLGVSQRISDLSDPRFRPTLPPGLNRPGTTVRGLFKICVSVAGQVNDVKILRSADPLVDGAWTTVIRRWQYKPFTLNGHATPFCHPLMLEVQSLRG